MSAAVPINDDRFTLSKPNRILTPVAEYNVDCIGEQAHGENDLTAKEDRMEAAITALAQAVTVSVQSQSQSPPKNGKSWPTYFASGAAVLAVLMSMSGVSFVPRAESDLGNKLNSEHKNVEIMQKQVDVLSGDLAMLRTWNEKLRNNMAAYGWLIDVEGNVHRINDKKERR